MSGAAQRVAVTAPIVAGNAGDRDGAEPLRD